MSRLVLLAALFALRGCEVADLLTDSSSDPTTSTSGEAWTEMLVAVNAARAEGRSCGDTWKDAVQPLAWDGALHRAARHHSRDMASTGRFSHTGSDGSRVGDRASRAGYAWRSVGENLALMDVPVRSVVDALLQSPAHCSAIMDPTFTELGAARESNYWTQVFGRPR